MTPDAANPSWIAGVPTAGVIAGAIVALCAWAALHRAGRPHWWALRLFVALGGVAIGTAALWLTMQSLARFLVLETAWDRGVSALIGAIIVEATTFFYRFEGEVLHPWTRRALNGLRLGFIVVLMLMLIEPALSWKTTHREERVVAVLVDVSASMDLADPQATVSEKLDLADLLLPDRLPPRLKPLESAAALRDTARRLGMETQWLSRLEADQGQADAERFAVRREQLIAALATCSKDAGGMAEKIRAEASAAAPPKALAESLEKLAANLTGRAGEVLSKVSDEVKASAPESLTAASADLRTRLQDANAALGDAAEQLLALKTALDDARYNVLPADLRSEVDKAAAQSRRRIAAAVLAEGKGSPGLVDKLNERYTVKVYRFAAQAAPTTLDEVRAAAATEKQEKSPDATRQSTDLAAALMQAQADTDAGQLSGIVVVGDGQHNAVTRLDAIGQALSSSNVPVASVLIGSTAPVVDAAVVKLVAPRTIQREDRLVVQSELKLTGLKGQTAEVNLVQGGRIADTKKIQVPGDAYETTVELVDQPKDAGLAAYEVKVAPLSNERTQDNNTQSAYVHVTDDPTRLLLIEDRPRWEFRYLRNLFVDRDKSVRLQYVLMRPDWLDGAPARAVVHASATRGLGESEASALPQNENELFLFDAVILGDVSPEQLGAEQSAALRKYVAERGGRLIVVAGQNHMPRSFAKSPLAELLPVMFGDKAAASAAEPGFYVRPSPDGAQHAVMQLEADPEANRRVWDGLPEQHVRYPAEAQPGARVLAFAMPLEKPECFRKSSEDPAEAEKLAKEREEFIRKNALVIQKRVGNGEVLMLNFDGTWRFRYQQGDTYHHRFWGQVVRWATAEKLAAGNDRVRLGTDRAVYEPREPVVAKARLRGTDHAPLTANGVSVTVTQGDKLITRKSLSGVAGSPGMYEADLGTLPEGASYKVALSIDDPAQKDLAELARKVATEVMVVPSRSLEVTELSADRVRLDNLAQQTAGIVVTPAKAIEVVEKLREGTREFAEEHRFQLWNVWPLFVVLMALVTTEWIIRKKAGLP